MWLQSGAQSSHNLGCIAVSDEESVIRSRNTSCPSLRQENQGMLVQTVDKRMPQSAATPMAFLQTVRLQVGFDSSETMIRESCLKYSGAFAQTGRMHSIIKEPCLRVYVDKPYVCHLSTSSSFLISTRVVSIYDTRFSHSAWRCAHYGGLYYLLLAKWYSGGRI